MTLEKYFGEFDEEARLTEKYKRINISRNGTDSHYHPAVTGTSHIELY